MTPKNAPLKLITDFVGAPARDPIPRSQTSSPSAHIAGLNRFFHPAGIPSRSATTTPIGMSALTPVDPFWGQQRDPFPPPSTSRSATPSVGNPPGGGGGGRLLTPVTESSPLDRTPIQRIGLELMAPAPPPPPPPPPPQQLQQQQQQQPPQQQQQQQKEQSALPPSQQQQQQEQSGLLPPALPTNISSPIETRNSQGFAQSPSVTLGDFNKMERAPTPPQPPQSTPSPAPSPPPPAPPASRTRSLSLRGPSGLQIQFPAMDQLLRSATPSILGGGDRKRHNSISKPQPQSSSPPQPQQQQQRVRANDQSFLDLFERGQKRLDSQRAAMPERTYPRKMSVERELVVTRGRTHEVKTSHQRSPSSPLPFSPQAALYRDGPDASPYADPPAPALHFNVPRYDAEPRRSATTARPRSPSSPADHRHHRHGNSELHPEEYDDERYYTSPRIPSRAPSRNMSRPRDPPRQHRDRDPSRRRDHRTSDRDRDPSRNRDLSQHRDPSRHRDLSRHRDRSRRRDGSSHRDRDGDRDRGRDRDVSRTRQLHLSPSSNNQARDRSRGRTRVKEVQASHLRSPSSPLPFSPQALLYQELSASDHQYDRDRESEEAEFNDRSRRRTTTTQRTARADSHTRGFGGSHKFRQQQQHESSLRRSRSERTLRQWSDQLENGNPNYMFGGASPALGSLSRNTSLSRGLPSNPRAWRADLQSAHGSRANSPAPGVASRARSPATVSRSVTPAPAPPPDRGRGRSPAPPSPLENRTFVAEAPYESVPTPPSVAAAFRRPSENRTFVAEAPYESVPTPPSVAAAFRRSPRPPQAPYESVPAPYESVPPYESVSAAPYESVPAPAPYESVPTLAPPAPQQQQLPKISSPLQTYSRTASPAPPPQQSRNASRVRGQSRSRNPPAPLSGSAANQYYSSPSLGSTADDSPPPPPPAPQQPAQQGQGQDQEPALSRSNSSHRRNNSEPAFKPLIRKLPPMPLSPPPLPQDFPVHHALQMNLEPGKKSKRSKRADAAAAAAAAGMGMGLAVGRRRQEELTPPQPQYDDDDDDDDEYYEDGDYDVDYDGSLQPGWTGEYRNPDEYYREMDRLQASLRSQHAKSPSAGGGSSLGRGGGSRHHSNDLGTMNMI